MSGSIILAKKNFPWEILGIQGSCRQYVSQNSSFLWCSYREGDIFWSVKMTCLLISPWWSTPRQQLFDDIIFLTHELGHQPNLWFIKILFSPKTILRGRYIGWYNTSHVTWACHSIVMNRNETIKVTHQVFAY